MDRGELERVLAWAKSRLQGGEEPPWTFYELMKLAEALEALLAGMDAGAPMPQTASSPATAPRRGAHLRLVATATPPDTVRRRRRPPPVILPT